MDPAEASPGFPGVRWGRGWEVYTAEGQPHTFSRSPDCCAENRMWGEAFEATARTSLENSHNLMKKAR